MDCVNCDQEINVSEFGPIDVGTLVKVSELLHTAQNEAKKLGKVLAIDIYTGGDDGISVHLGNLADLERIPGELKRRVYGSIDEYCGQLYKEFAGIKYFVVVHTEEKLPA